MIFYVLNQFIDQNSENAIDSIVEPLYEGNRYIDKIYPKGQRFYRHARKSKSKTYSVLVVKQGIVNVRQGKCITFPYCKLDISNTSNYIKIRKKNMNFMRIPMT